MNRELDRSQLTRDDTNSASRRHRDNRTVHLFLGAKLLCNPICNYTFATLSCIGKEHI